MVLIPMFLPFSFDLETLSLPVPDSFFASSWNSFLYAGENASPFYMNYYQNLSGLYKRKLKEKPGWKHKLKERGKVERGEEV